MLSGNVLRKMEEEEQTPEGLVESERTHYFHLQSSQTHHQFNQTKGWSMVAIRDSCFDNDDDRSIVFPPINHEGLHISSSSSSSSSSSHSNLNQHNHKSSPPTPTPPPPLSSFPLDAANGDTLPSLLSISKPRWASDVARWWGLGLALLRSKVTGIASLLQSYAAANRGTFWSLRSVGGVALAVLLSLLYMRRRRQRHSQLQNDSKDHLILLIKERDEISPPVIKLEGSADKNEICKGNFTTSAGTLDFICPEKSLFPGLKPFPEVLKFGRTNAYLGKCLPEKPTDFNNSVQRGEKKSRLKAL